MITVVKEVSEPRLPTLRGKKKARASEIPVWTADAIGAEAEKIGLKGSPTRVVKIFRPKVARECTKVAVTDEASIEQAVDGLIQMLESKDLI